MAAHILICSQNESFLSTIHNVIGDLPYEYRQVGDISDIKKLELNYKPLVILIDLPEDKAALLKIYETVYDRFRNSKIVVVYDRVLPFDAEEIGGRRQNMTFLQHPYEDELLVNLVLEYAPIEIPPKKLRLEHLNPISLSDIRPSDKFNFDLYFYMPANKKLLLYRRKNSTLNEKQITNFQKFKIHDLFVRKNEMGPVRQYLSQKLKGTFGNKAISKTEKRLLLQKQVKDIMGNFFAPSPVNFAQNKIILETCKQVMGKFIMDVSPQPEIYEKILQYTSQNRGNYAHAVNVSVFSSLFAIALGYDDVESASIGGVLHDIGVSSLPAGISDKLWEEMSEEDKRIYQTHPDTGLKLLENKKIIAMENARMIVAQHHERMDGKGYPKGLKSDAINPYAKICQIADELDELTSVHPNRKLMSPLEALEEMMTKNSDALGEERFDFGLLAKLKAIFMNPTEFKAEPDNVRDIFSRPVAIKDPNASPQEDSKRRRRHKKALG